MLRPAYNSGAATLTYSFASRNANPATARPKLTLTLSVPAGQQRASNPPPVGVSEPAAWPAEPAAPAALTPVPVGQRWVSYYFLGGQRSAMRERTAPAGSAPAENQVYYLLSDHLGSTSVVVNAQGSEVGRQRYDPYGAPRPAASTLPTDRRFTGQRSEEATLGALVDFGARPYAPSLGRFLAPDTIVPDPANPQSLNRYAYALNQPVKYRDPSGHWVETAWDVLNIGWDIYEVKNDPSLLNIGALIVDVGAAALPFVPAGAGLIARGGKAAKAAVEVAEHADDVADAVKAVTRVEQGAEVATRGLRALSRASDFKLQSYNSLRKVLTEAGESGLEAHHLIEKRFAERFGMKEGNIVSVAVTKEEHQMFTNAWRKAIGYNGDKALITTANASKEDIWRAARDIYAKYPELLEAARQALFN